MDPDQILLLEEQSDLGPHCLLVVIGSLRVKCPNLFSG